MRDEAPGGLAAGTGRVLVRAAAAARGEDELFALAERLRARVAREIGAELPAGAGRAVAAGDLRRGSTRRAARWRRGRWRGDDNGDGAGPPLLATYRDLGSFQLLLSLQDDDALRLFCDSILAPDRGRRGRLRRRADALARGLHRVQRPVGAGGAPLFCHRHTLRYRIRRVEELTGRSLDSRARPHRLLARAARARAASDLTKGTCS